MKQFYFFIFLCICFFETSAESNAGEVHLIRQEIRYINKDANEVFFVWGINSWTAQDKRLWPAGTYEKGSLLSTPMKAKNGVFSVELYCLPNTVVDYVFWITKGPKDIPCDIWDVNTAPQKDYHSAAFNDNITIINAKTDIKPAHALTLLDYSGHLLLVVAMISLVAFIVRKKVYKNMNIQPKLSRAILSVGFVVFVCNILSRASVAKLSWDIYYEPFKNMPKLLWSGYYDFIFVFGITVFFFCLNYFLRNFPKVQKASFIIFSVLCFFSLLAGVLNIKVVEAIGRPFNYRWFYYSGFLNSADSKAAVSSNISSSYILGLVYLIVTSTALCILLIYLLEFLLAKLRLRKVPLILFICVNLGYALKARSAVAESTIKYDLLANPVAAFAVSVNPFSSGSELFSLSVPDSLVYRKPTHGSKKIAPRDSKIKNVILLVLESTPAEYIQPYDSIYKVTPTMIKYLSHSIVFENIYAHAPATNKSMVCLLGSVYPWLSYTSVTQEHPGVVLPTLSSELKKKGYRTAFFNSADNNFQRAGEFLSNRKFDLIKDRKNLNCVTRFEETEHEADPLDGVDDECSADELMTWVNNDESAPFFCVMWTYQTHYPYYSVGKRKVFAEHDTVFNRYLNAVNHSDAVLEKILEKLKANNLLESTLVAVIGDHGEAFGRHNQFTHASAIYEENVHIPFVLINPAFKVERCNVTGGTVDVAPTIMELLGQAAPEAWQGASLFSKKYSDRTYFFCPWSDYLFGYKEGDMKYIFNATKNTSEVYNIKNDPCETTNLSFSSEREKDVAQQKLAAWAQYQDGYMKKLLK